MDELNDYEKLLVNRILTQPHNSLPLGEFEHSSNPRPHEDSIQRVKRFLEEMGFRIIEKKWGDRWQMHRLIITNRRESEGFGFTDSEKAVYIACCVLRLLQDAPITKEAVKDILHRKYRTIDEGEEKRLSIDLKKIENAVDRLEERGILKQSSDGIYKEGWSFDGVYWDSEDVILKLKTIIEIDEIASMKVNIENNEDVV